MEVSEGFQGVSCRDDHEQACVSYDFMCLSNGFDERPKQINDSFLTMHFTGATLYDAESIAQCFGLYLLQ